VGCNSRLDSVQAVVLSAKLPHLDDYCDARRKAADHYDHAFKNIQALQTPFRSSSSTHVFHQYTLKVKNGLRDSLKEYLDSQKIPSMIYYPVPLYKQKAFAASSGGIDFLPHTDSLCQEVISLPMHTELTEEQLNFITQKVTDFFQHHS
jgi:dTDP-4-amino-4,6-dideoxygalactose transaminase